jgi:hypothetical protein
MLKIALSILNVLHNQIHSLFSFMDLMESDHEFLLFLEVSQQSHLIEDIRKDKLFLRVKNLLLWIAFACVDLIV